MDQTHLASNRNWVAVELVALATDPHAHLGTNTGGHTDIDGLLIAN
jgi:hypothetical protein